MSDFVDDRLPLAEQLRRLFFPAEAAKGFMAEQAAVSIEGGFAYLLGKGFEDQLERLVASVADLEQGKVEALERLLAAVESHKEEVDQSIIEDSGRDHNDFDEDLYARAEEIRRAHPPRQPRLPGS